MELQSHSSNLQSHSSNLPYEISYDITIMPPHVESEIINGWDKIDYTTNTHNIIRSRFSGDTSSIPGLDKVFEMMAIEMDKKAPLDELNSRANINDREHTDLSQLKKSK
jgi:hypothetical protein